MDAKITHSYQTNEGITVQVCFFEKGLADDNKTPIDINVHTETYYLTNEQTVDDLKPKIKEDIQKYLATKEKLKEVTKFHAQTIDLKGVETPAESAARIEKEAKTKRDLEPKEAPVDKINS